MTQSDDADGNGSQERSDHRRAHVPLPVTSPTQTQSMGTLTKGIGIDIGCGPNKAPGTQGIDVIPGPGVDHVMDLEKDPLPFEDDSVEYVFSSNTFEHIANYHWILLNELPRVMCDGARYELWMPRAFHNNMHVFGHVTVWNEEPFFHIARNHRDFWGRSLGATWDLTELVFQVDWRSFEAVLALGWSPGMAIRHLTNIVHEFGVMGQLHKPGDPASPPPELKVFWSPDRNRDNYQPLTSPVWW
ncbi:MAG: class I SAM-dependent methyltransferase [Miltoncostaeaceae bacterium]